MPETKTEKRLDIPNKLDDQMLYGDAIKALVSQKKQELNDLNHNIELAKITLRQTQDSCIKHKSAFDNQLNMEKQRFESEKNNKLNELSSREERVRNLEKNLNERLTSVQQREQANLKIEDERKAIFAERIEAENMKNEATIQLQKTLSLQSEASSKMSNSALIDKQAKEKLNEATARLNEANNKLDKAEQALKDIEEQKENLEKIREALKPQLDILEKEKKANLDVLEQIKIKEHNIQDKIKENKQLSDSLSDRFEIIRKRELELATLEEELRRSKIKDKLNEH